LAPELDGNDAVILTYRGNSGAAFNAELDLDGLWRSLGVERVGDAVRFRDDAPEAAIRKAMTAPAPAATR
ncbi:MAG: hypothetical protein ABMB14_40790, partial [Myxococcota bacterium]